jgi:hemerythrin superfamily protein
MGLFTTNPVFDMLKKDHKKVEGLFDEFEAAEDARSKTRIIQETLRELEVHAQLEEELIYPAIRKKIDEADIMDEALEEHHVAHLLINELKRMKHSDGRYEAKFTVLGESIKHHVKEEEGTMFPEAEKADLNWDELGHAAMERKEELMARISHRASRSKNGKTPSRKRRSRSHRPRVKKAA